MKRIICFFLIAYLLLSFTLYAGESKNSGTATALFLTVPPDPRSSAMGGAGVGRGDDVSTVFWNPAGLVNIEEFGLIFSHAEYLADFNHNFCAAALSVENIGSFGVSFNYIGVDPFKGYDADGNELEEFNTFEDMSFNGSYARNVYEFIAVGGTLKYISQNLADKSAISYAIDAGVFAKGILLENLSAGLAAKNLGTSPALGSESDSLPFQISLGVSYTYDLLGMLESTSVIDINYPNYYDLNFGIGEELRIELVKEFAVCPRFGFKSPYEHGLLSGLTLGLGIRFLNYNIDFSYLNYGDDLQSIYRFSLSIAGEGEN